MIYEHKQEDTTFVFDLYISISEFANIEPEYPTTEMYTVELLCLGAHIKLGQKNKCVSLFDMDIQNVFDHFLPKMRSNIIKQAQQEAMKYNIPLNFNKEKKDVDKN